MTPTTSLVASIQKARAETDALFHLVRPESMYDRPIAERHRIVFYVGHLEAFDWNLCRELLGLEALQPEFDRLFAFGIDPAIGQARQDEPSDWPAMPEVNAYVRRVRESLDRHMAELPSERLHVALEHRLMHAETLAYMLHNLPFEAKLPPDGKPGASGPAPAGRFIEIPAGTATLGREAGDGFGWDNEFRAHHVGVAPFAIAQHKVTNGEYLEFVRKGAAPPHFWVRRGNAWFYRGMFHEIPLPLDWPVYVTWQEADAYARWKGKALPSEAQFHRAAFGTPSGYERQYPWGDGTPSSTHGNFDSASWDPEPVGATPRSDSAFGVSQMVGNGWEWTSTVFGPFEGFERFPFYPGYSADFFDGAHYVIKGGSARTAAPLIRRSFRNWFRPDYPYVYAGLRLVEN